jgi:hypothetical protein
VVHVVTKLLTRAEIAHGRKLLEQAFEGPWRYNQWQVECRACEGGTTYNSDLEGECVNPDCDGTHVPATWVEAPEAYPASDKRPQVVATIEVPGIDTLAQANGECICWLRNNAEALLEAREQLDDLVSALAYCSSVGKAVLPSPAATVASVLTYAESLGWKRDAHA